MKGIISSDKQEGYTRWQAPDVNFQSGVEVSAPAESKAQMIARIKKEAFEQGKQAAMQSSERVIKDECTKTLSEQCQLLKNILEEIKSPLKACGEEIETQLVQLVRVITKKLFRQELTVKPEQILAIIQEARGLLPAPSDHLKIHLHPEDLTLIQSLPDGDDALVQLLVEDAAAQRGDCRISSDACEVDATLENRIQNIIKQVFDNAA